MPKFCKWKSAKNHTDYLFQINSARQNYLPQRELASHTFLFYIFPIHWLTYLKKWLLLGFCLTSHIYRYLWYVKVSTKTLNICNWSLESLFSNKNFYFTLILYQECKTLYKTFKSKAKLHWLRLHRPRNQIDKDATTDHQKNFQCNDLLMLIMKISPDS